MLRRGILKRAYNALAATLGVCCATLFMPAAPKGTHRTPASPDSVALAKRGIDLVETGHCEAALPLLKRAMPQIADRQFRYRTAMAEARCAMAIDDRDTAIAALLQLEHEFPEDPEA
ncbi:MAG: hypothetical protein JO061_19280, partial [Acidobacteriaceae bacterium]|nr:hypothetical protein [Acidobacteriaceae bacterium]